jgi:hypothetical protein
VPIRGARPPLPCEGSMGPCTVMSISRTRHTASTLLGAESPEVALAKVPHESAVPPPAGARSTCTSPGLSYQGWSER